jgi:hypothetical protein
LKEKNTSEFMLFFAKSIPSNPFSFSFFVITNPSPVTNGTELVAVVKNVYCLLI